MQIPRLSVVETFEDIKERYRAQLIAGMDPDPNAFAAVYPEWADELLEVLPAVENVERLKREAGCVAAESTPYLESNTLGSYRLLREIGRGGTGTVFEAEHEKTGCRCAIKVLNEPHTKDRVERFNNEARYVSNLHHGNIIPITDVQEADGIPFLVMKLVDGNSLEKILQMARELRQHAKHGRSKPEMDIPYPMTDFSAIALLFADAASALQHAHDHGTLHRDVKPGNLVVDVHGSVWLTDFGFAKIEGARNDSITGSGLVVGTPQFMAPEQRGGNATASSDIYGLGMTMKDVIDESVKLAKAMELPTRPAGRLQQIAEKAAHTEIRERYDSIEDLRIDLLRYLESEIVGDRLQIQWSRYKSPLIVISLIVAAFVAGRILNLRATRITPQDDVVEIETQISENQHQRQSTNVIEIPRRAVNLVDTGQSGSDDVESKTKTVTHFAAAPPSKANFEGQPIQRYVDEATGVTTLDIPILTSSDDAEEYDMGKMYLDSTDLEMTWDGIDQLVGLRFSGIPVPPQAIIVHAAIQFQCDESDVGETVLSIRGEATGDAAEITDENRNLSSRRTTKSFVTWRPGPWYESERTKNQCTPNLSPVVQEIVNGDDWEQGNSMAFVISGTGKRSAVAFDEDETTGPQLRIQYREMTP